MTRKARPRLLAAALALALAAPAAARAQQPDPHSIADDAFKRGREAMNKSDYKRALTLLRTSQGLEPGRGKLINIAICEDRIGMVGSALRHYREVLPQLPDGDERAQIAKERIHILEDRAPHLRVTLAPGSPLTTTVVIDGEPIALTVSGADVPLDAGKHVVLVTAPGASEKRYEVDLTGPGHTPLTVSPTGDVPPPAEGERPARSPRWTLGVAGIGAGGALVFIGLGVGGAALGKHGDLKAACNADGTCPSSETDALHAYHTLGIASTTTFVLGLALAGAGTVLVLTAPRAAPPQSAWIAPVVGLGALGVRGGF